MRFRPLGKRIVVKRKIENTNATGIIISTDTSKDKPLEGIVKAIGDEIINIKTDEVVLFGKYSGSEITVDGEVYILLMLDDVSGVLDEK